MNPSGLVLILAMLTGPGLVNAQDRCATHTYFNEESACFDQAPPVPQAVLDAILETKDARDSWDYMTPVERAKVRDLLKGVVIHLHSPRQQDMMVRGAYTLSGADNTWFWIVTNVGTHHPSAFFLQGNSVTLLASRHHGYFDIRTDWAIATQSERTIFRFDGQRYKLFRSVHKDAPLN